MLLLNWEVGMLLALQKHSERTKVTQKWLKSDSQGPTLEGTEIAAIFAIRDCDALHAPQKSLAISETLHCDLRVRWKVASDLRFRVAISEPETSSFRGICGDLAPSTQKSLAIAIVRFWCAKVPPQSDSQVTQKWLQNEVWSHFWVNFRSLWGPSAGVTVESSGWRKRGVEFKGGSLHDGFGGFDGFGGSGKHLALLLLVLQKYRTKRQPWLFWRFWRFWRLWRFRSWRLPPLNSTPLFRDPEVTLGSL